MPLLNRKFHPVTLAAIFGLVVLAVYLVFLSDNYNGDGLGYARIVEQADSDQLFSVSARLLYCPTGRLGLHISNLFGLDFRSVRVLQIINALFGALGAGVFFLTAHQISRSIRQSLLVSIGLASSLAFWFWCTNATSYPGNVFFLLVTLYLIVRMWRTSSYNKYIILSLLVGLSHALAGFYWLTALLLVPAVALSMFISGHTLKFRQRLSAVVVYGASFLFFLLVPLLIAGFATGRISNLSEFPSWLRAASYGIPPSLSLQNFSRGIIGFSSSFFHLTQIGPVVKQLIWGVPFALTSKIRLYSEIAAFVLLWVFVAMTGLCLYLNRMFAFVSRFRLTLVLLAWALVPLIFGLVWLGSDTERWLAGLPIFWLLVLMCFQNPEVIYESKFSRIFQGIAWVFVLMIFVYNFSFAILPHSKPVNNQYMQAAAYFDSKVSGEDLLLLWGHDHVFTADHLAYFYKIPAIHLYQEARERPSTAIATIQREVDARLNEGHRVFVIGRIFLEEDLPESHAPTEGMAVTREDFAELFDRWRRTPAFDQGKDTYWQLTR